MTHDKIEKFIRDFKGTDVSVLKKDFKNFCKTEGILNADFLLWKQTCWEFLCDNPTYHAGWKQIYILESVNNI